MYQHIAIASALNVFLFACAPVPEPEAESRANHYDEYDIGMLHAAMENGELTSRTLVDYYLERIAAIDHSGPELRSIIEINPDAQALADRLDAKRQNGESRGPLHGIPVVLKANIDTGDQLATTALR